MGDLNPIDFGSIFLISFRFRNFVKVIDSTRVAYSLIVRICHLVSGLFSPSFWVHAVETPFSSMNRYVFCFFWCSFRCSDNMDPLYGMSNDCQKLSIYWPVGRGFLMLGFSCNS